jgi:glycosyltransferase involved in cell wall biosynthesis
MENISGEKTRIGLIGPVLPYRGGIAHHTTLLHRELSQRSELLTISFKRQYPLWLYPGKSDLDPGYTGHKEPHVIYAIDSLNPLTWLKACRMFLDRGVKTVIIPWWTVYWAPSFGAMAWYLRRKKVQVLFLCHNVIEHESAFWKTSITRLVFLQGTHFFVHTREDASNLKALIETPNVSVHPMPLISQFPQARGTLPRRASLELLFFGTVRPYKGLDVLVKAMSLLEDEDVFLSIVGEWWEKRLGVLKNSAGTKVEIVDRYVSEQEAAEYFARADIVVLPYRSATGSAVIPVAYHYGKPVIATSVGGLPDVVEDGISGKLVKSEDPVALADMIRGFLKRDLQAMHEGVRNISKRLTWESLVNNLIHLISQ